MTEEKYNKISDLIDQLEDIAYERRVTLLNHIRDKIDNLLKEEIIKD